MGMLKTISQAWKVAEIRSKMIFTLLMLLVFRIGSNIPVPNINREVLAQMFTGETGLFDLFDLFSGGAFSNFTIFALSITPYITASIIVQLLGMAFPYFQRLAESGTEGRKKMAQITRYMTVVLGLIQAIGLTIGLFRKAVIDKGVFSIILVILVLTAGTAFLMWLGEQINEKGVGNGISLIIFAGIVARIPSGIRSLATSVEAGSITIITLVVLAVVAVLVIAGVVLIQEGQRRIPVQYAKRVVKIQETGMDIRIEKTERAIKNAFLELRGKKPLEKITVIELCRLACINKSTFYGHYEDIYDLSDTLEEELVQSILSSISWDETYNPQETDAFTQALCMAFLANISLIRILFSGKEQGRLGSRLEAGIKEQMYQRYPDYRDDAEKSILFSYMIQGAYHAYLNHQDADTQTLVRVLGEVAGAIKTLY